MTGPAGADFVAAAAQLSGVSSVEEALTSCLGLIGEADARDVDLLVFSELALSPYFAVVPEVDPAPYAMRLDDERLDVVRAAAKSSGMWVVLPFAERYNGRLFNSAAIIAADGSVADVYRKVHIPRGFRRDDGSWSNHESDYFAAGDRFPVVDTGFTRLGVLICYDRFFPEGARRLALEGATTIAYPSANRSHGSDWAGSALRLLIRARAYENACFTISSSKGGVEGENRFLANSSIATPVGGQELAVSEGESSELVVAECRAEDLGYARRRLDWEGNRRGDLYSNLRVEAAGAPLRASVGAC